MADEEGRSQKYPQSVKVAANGTAEVTFTCPVGTLVVSQVRVTVSTAVSMPTATLYLNGVDYAGSYTGANESATGTETMQGQDTLRCVWTGADPGATATMTVFGKQRD